jgi:ATP-dependent Zn protease
MGSDAARAEDAAAISEHRRRQLDEEQHELSYGAQRRAHELITSHRPQLDALAARLLEHEVLERADIDRIMGELARVRPRQATPALRVAAAEALDDR